MSTSGKSLTRLIDVVKDSKISKRYTEAILSAKVDTAYRALSSWPTYISYEEDVLLREESQMENKMGKPKASLLGYDGYCCVRIY